MNWSTIVRNSTRCTLTVWIALTALAGVKPALAASADDQQAGRALYQSMGCFECHGLAAQGSTMSGPPLSPNTPSFDAMRAYVRSPKGQMPVYSEKILSTADLMRIHDYLASLPAPRSPDSIALLTRDAGPSTALPHVAPATASEPSLASMLTHGQAVYAANCAACHGANGSGAAGPALRGLSLRIGTAAIEAQVRSPVGTMPALFPSVINEVDVRDVVRYVATLK